MAKKKRKRQGVEVKNQRIVLRTGEALVEAEPGWSAAEPEVVIGELDGPVGYAIANLIGDQVKGHTRVFAILNSDVQVRPATLMVSKVTVKSGKYTNILMGTVQAAIAHGVLDAVRAGDIPKRKVNDLGIIVSVWLDPSVLEAEQGRSRGALQDPPRSDGQGDPQGDAPRADDRLAAGEPGQGAALFPPAGGGGEAVGWAVPTMDREQWAQPPYEIQSPSPTNCQRPLILRNSSVRPQPPDRVALGALTS